MMKKGVSIAFFVVNGNNFQIKFFKTFFEAKMTKFVILDQKPIVLGTFLIVFITFSNFRCRIAIFTVQAQNTQKWYFLVSNPIF